MVSCNAPRRFSEMSLRLSPYLHDLSRLDWECGEVSAPMYGDGFPKDRVQTLHLLPGQYTESPTLLRRITGGHGDVTPSQNAVELIYAVYSCRKVTISELTSYRNAGKCLLQIWLNALNNKSLAILCPNWSVLISARLTISNTQASPPTKHVSYSMLALRLQTALKVRGLT